MDMKKLLMSIICCIGILGNLAAQNVTGKVIDEANQPLAYANVILQTADSTYLAGTTTNENGMFELAKPEEAKLISVSFVGYISVGMNIAKQSDLGIIQLLPDTQVLGEVVVKGDLPKTQIKGNAMITTVTGSILEKTGTMEQLLDRIPNVMADNGKITVFGRGTPVIYINGRQMRDKSELERLSPDNIKNIEVITNPGVRYEASVTSVIRITTKKATGEGFGFDNQLSLSLTNEKDWAEEERFNFNYRKGGFDLNGMLSVAQSDVPDDKTLTQYTFLKETWKQESRIKQTYENQQYASQLAASYQFNDRHSAGASLTYYHFANGSEGEMNSTVEKDNVLAETSFTDYTTPSDKGDYVRGNLYYVGKVGKLKIDFNTDWIWNTQDEKMQTREIYQETGDEQENREIHTSTDTRNQLIASKLVLTYPIAKGNLSWGMEYSHSNRKTIYEVLPTDLIDDDHSRIKEGMTTTFIEYSRAFGKLWLQAGLRYEHIDFNYYENDVRLDEQSRKFDDFFPSLSLSMPIGKTQMSLSYGTNIYRPGYWQLRSNITYGNRYTYEAGNPFLKSQKSNNLSYALAWKWLSFQLNYIHYNNPIINYSQTYKDNPSVALLTTVNGNDYDACNASLNLNPSFGIWHPVLTAAIHKQWYNMDGVHLNTPRGTFRFNNTLTGKLGSFTLMCTYQTKGDNDNITIKDYFKTSFSYYKSLMKERLSISFYADNLFNVQTNCGEIYSGTLRKALLEPDARRSFYLTLRYKFNSTKSKYKGTGAGNSQKSRM